MRGIDSSFMRAAISMGSTPLGSVVQNSPHESLPRLPVRAFGLYHGIGWHHASALPNCNGRKQMISNIIAFHAGIQQRGNSQQHSVRYYRSLFWFCIGCSTAGGTDNLEAGGSRNSSPHIIRSGTNRATQPTDLRF
jgi:hypothetical protein